MVHLAFKLKGCRQLVTRYDKLDPASVVFIAYIIEGI